MINNKKNIQQLVIFSLKKTKHKKKHVKYFTQGHRVIGFINLTKNVSTDYL